MTLTVRGKVIRGTGEARTIGFPTVNLDPISLPPTVKHGIYAARLIINEKKIPGVAYIGPRFSSPHTLVCEMHAFSEINVRENENIVLDLVDYIREVKKFENVDELKSQIEKDVKHAKSLLQ